LAGKEGLMDSKSLPQVSIIIWGKKILEEKTSKEEKSEQKLLYKTQKKRYVKPLS